MGFEGEMIYFTYNDKLKYFRNLYGITNRDVVVGRFGLSSTGMQCEQVGDLSQFSLGYNINVIQVCDIILLLSRC